MTWVTCCVVVPSSIVSIHRSPGSIDAEPSPETFVFEIWHDKIHLGTINADVLRLVLTLFFRPGPEPGLARAREAPLAVPLKDVAHLRATLKDLDTLPLAALLRELGAVLHNREIIQWRALTDVSDELVDQATAPARGRLAEQAFPDDAALAKGPVAAPARAALRQQRRTRRRTTP